MAESEENEQAIDGEPVTVESNGANETITVIEQPPLGIPVVINHVEPEPPPAVVEQPKPRFTSPDQCPECGKSGFDSNKGLLAHIRFKHQLPRQRKEAAERKLQAGAIPAPDFSDIPGAAPQPSPIAVIPDARFEGMANMTFDMTTGLLTRIFGPEWQPTPDQDNPQVSHERMTVVMAIKKYYESVNLPDIPPGYMLCFVALAYAAPRMSAQPTKTKMQMVWLWLKGKFQKRKPGIPTIVK